MTSSTDKKLLLIGASRGLGLAMAEEYLQRGWFVTATERRSSPALRELSAKSKGRLEIEIVDITSPNQVTALRSRLSARSFNMVFVNAGITNPEEETACQVSTLEFERVMVTNTLSPIRVLETFLDLVPESGTLGVMSSGQGSVSNNLTGRWEVYRASKAALNSLMRSFRARLSDDPRTMLLMAPGWVRTDMGGPKARLSIDESIPRLVATIEAQAGKGGLQFLDYTGAVVPW
jgi:NAD(P)-dependent dehydrogenase (short-subunit alcohol dehydrogenase family)